MKNKKQNKIKPSEPATFVAAAQAAALETAQRVVNKLAVLTYAVLPEGDLEKASDHAVSVYQRYESVDRTSYGNDVKSDRYLVLDVLINPDKLNDLDTAKLLHQDTLPEITLAKQKAPAFQLGAWGTLEELIHDNKAISTVFRVSVLMGPGDKPQGLYACSYRRNDRIGELNAVQYGSKTGVERLLVRPMGVSRPCRQGDWNCPAEKMAAVTCGYASNDANIERIIASAVELCQPYNSLCGESIQRCLDGLTTEKIDNEIHRAIAYSDLKARLFSMVRELEARTGLKVVAGPRLNGPDYKLTETIALMAPHDDCTEALGFHQLHLRQESLEALHKALVK